MRRPTLDVDGLTYIALYWKADFYYCLIYGTFIDFSLRILLPIFVMRRNYSQIYKLVQLWEPEGRRQTLFSMTAVFVVTMLPKVISIFRLPFASTSARCATDGDKLGGTCEV